MKPVTLALLASRPASGQSGREVSDATLSKPPGPPRQAGRLKGEWACTNCGGTNVYEEDGKLKCMDCEGR
ncbi:MAG: hypothetical protein NT130_03530 [Candidatus Micrarchaeota archaeon]|nr:hypothetical protein [Candidatus Micrarchaeota archaeon]